MKAGERVSGPEAARPDFLQLDRVGKSFGATDVIRGVSLAAARGEFVVFVGPSGCGKSTLLRLVAGLEEVSSGRIRIDGTDVTDRLPADRGVAMVFQSYALYPHMSVRENMSFGLKMIKTPPAQIAKRVATAAGILKLDALLERRPRELSGGQRQRVAIGRAIVREPRLFLFDEPLSNLDAELRAEMRVEIARLHRELGSTMVYVTHDQVEAMTLADRIVVLRSGQVEQIGTPAELYDQPVNTFVAGFIGSPKMNFLPVESRWVGDGVLRLSGAALGDALVSIPLRNGTATAAGQVLTLGLRPEHIGIGDGTPLRFSAKADYVEHLGGSSLLYARTPGGHRVIVQSAGRLDVAPGDTVALGARVDRAYVFDEQGQALQ